MEIKIAGRVVENKFKVRNTNRWQMIMRHFDGKDVLVTVEENIDTRSNNQNKLYWAYLDLIEKETGNDANVMHIFFKKKFLPPKFADVFGQTVELERSTTKLDKLEFTQYLAKIEELTGIKIPSSEE